MSILILFPAIIYQFKDAVINIWDESLYANNSIEMWQNGDIFNYHYNGNIEHHNTKPPIVIWLQAFSYSIFGFTEFAVRFPTYLALACTILISIIFSKKVFNSLSIGFLAALFMLTSKALMRKHVFLTGDLDGVLVFFTTSFIFYSFYLVYKNPIRFSGKQYFLYFSIFTLAWFAKSTAILLLIPSSVLPFVFYGNMKKFIWSKLFWLGGTVSAIIIISYYFFRETNNPGVFQIVLNSEFTRIYKNLQPWLQYERSFYFDELKDLYFKEYYYFTLALLIPVIFIPEIKFRKEIFLLILISVVYLIVITIPESKMFWYAAPAYPILCLALALLCHSVYDFISSKTYRFKTLSQLLIVFFIGSLLSFQTKQIIAFVNKEKTEVSELEYEIYALKSFAPLLSEIDTCQLFHPINPAFIHHLDVLYFYKTVYDFNRGTKLKIASELKKGDYAIVSNPQFMDSLEKQHDFTVIDSVQYGKLIRVDK